MAAVVPNGRVTTQGSTASSGSPISGVIVGTDPLKSGLDLCQAVWTQEAIASRIDGPLFHGIRASAFVICLDLRLDFSGFDGGH
jgi:hypothetical protein